MKKAAAGFALILTLSSCSFSPFRPTVQSGMSVNEEEIDDIQQNGASAEPLTVPKLYSSPDEIVPILCKIRRYEPDTYIKSDLIIQADGRVWCGFYTQNEGVIGADNILRNSSEEETADFSLMDDQWMDAYLSVDLYDDFMLFGEICELGTLSDGEIKKLESYIASVKPDADTVTSGSIDENADIFYYADLAVSDSSGNKVRVPVLAEIGDYRIESSDINAKNFCKAVMDSSKEYYNQWNELCNEKMHGGGYP